MSVPPSDTPARAAQVLLAGDLASQSLGLRLVSVSSGEARMTMQVRPDMVNGHGICHGGLIFTLADSAFAFACNSYGDNAVAVNGSIDFLAPVRAGDELTAQARELWRSHRHGIYEAQVTNQDGNVVALFRGRSQRIDGRLIP